MEHRVPSVEAVCDALRAAYEHCGSDWEYKDLFAALSGLQATSPFALGAQAMMRREYPEFQRRASVLTPGGEPKPDAVRRQARAVVAVWERAQPDGRADDTASGVWPAGGGTPPLRLQWRGPFGSTRGGFPLVFDRPEAASPGLYLWTVALPEGHLVAYVGKTDRSLAQRLREEVEYHLGGRDGFWDVELYRRGGRRRIDAPPSGVDVQLREILGVCSVFIAPASVSPPLLERLESGVIRHLRQAGEQCNQFLANRRCLAPSGPGMTVPMTFDSKVIGLGEVVVA